MGEPVWLTAEDVIRINRETVRLRGEGHAVLSFERLASAVSRPRAWCVYGNDDVAFLTAILMEGLAQAHAFEQGNKRTAFIAGQLFLRRNGYILRLPDTRTNAEMLIRLIERKMPVWAFADVLADHLSAID